jgi:PncC family amidohydrolase
MEGEDLATQVASMLDGRTVATAESCTAGRIAAALACVPGAADFLCGGVVAYQEAVKRDVLGVVAESVLSLNCSRAG